MRFQRAKIDQFICNLPSLSTSLGMFWPFLEYFHKEIEYFFSELQDFTN